MAAMEVKGFRLDLVREKDLNGLNSSCLDSQQISYKDQRGNPKKYTWFNPIRSSQHQGPIHGLFSFDSKFRSNDSITSEQFFCLPPEPRLVDLMVTIKTYRPNISPISGQLQPFGYQNNHQLNSRNVRLALRYSFQPFYTVPLQNPSSTGFQNQDLFYKVLVNGFREDGSEVELAVFAFFVPLDKDPPPPPNNNNRPLPNNFNSNRPRVEIPDNSMECASVYSIPITPIQDQFPSSSSTPTTSSSSTTSSSLDPNAPLPRIPKRLKTGDFIEDSSTKNNGKGKEVEKGVRSGQETVKAGDNGTKVKDGKKSIGKGSGKTLKEASKKKPSTISPIKPPTPSSSSKPILTPSWTDPNGIEFFAPANNKSTVKPPPQVKVQSQNQIEASKSKRINSNPSPIDTLASSKSKLRSESPLTPSTSTSTATPNNWHSLSRQPQPNPSSSATPISTQSHSRVETFSPSPQPMDLDDASSKSGFSSSDSTSPTEHLSAVDEEMQVEEEEEEEGMIRPNLNAETSSSNQLQSSIKGKSRRDSISRYTEKRDKESLGGGGGRRRTRSRSPPPIPSSSTNPNPNSGRRRSVRDEETGGYRWESIPPDDDRSSFSSSSFSERPVRFFGDHKEKSELELKREQESLNNIKRREEECSNHILKREEESRERIRIGEMEFKERLQRKEEELEQSLKRKREELERDFKRMEEEYERERKRKEEEEERERKRKDEEFGMELKRKEEDLVDRLKKMEVSSRDEIKRKEEESLAQIKRKEEESQVQIKRHEEQSQAQIKRKEEDSEARIRIQEEISNSAILKKMEEVNSELEKKKAASLEKETTLQKKEEEVRLKLEKMELEDASRNREQSNSVSLEQSRHQLQEQIKSLETEFEKKRQQLEVDMERTKMIMEEEYKKRKDFFVGDLQKCQDGIEELRNNKMVHEQEFNKRIEAADRFQADHMKELEKQRFKLNHDYQTALQIKDTLLNECNQVRTELEFMNASLFTLRGQCALNLDNRNKLNEEVKMLESMKGNLFKGSSSTSSNHAITTNNVASGSSASSNSHQSSPSSKLWELHPRQYEFSQNQSQNMHQIGHQQIPQQMQIQQQQQQQQFNSSQQQAQQQQLSALYQQSISHQPGNQQQNQQQISAELRERHQREQQLKNQQFLQNQQRQQNSAPSAQNPQSVRSMKSRKNLSMPDQPAIVGSAPMAHQSPNDSYASQAENPRRIQMTDWHPAQVGNQKQRSTTHPNPSQENAMQGQSGGSSNSTRARQSSSSQNQPSNQGYYDHTTPDMQAWQQYLADVGFTRSSIDPTTGQMRLHKAPIQRSVSNQSSPSGGNQSIPLHHPSTLAAQAQENRKRKRFSTGEVSTGEQASEQALLDFQSWQSRESGNNGGNGSSSTIPMSTSAVDPNNNNQVTAAENWTRNSGQRSSSDTIVSQQNQSTPSNHSRVGSGGTVGVQNHDSNQNQNQSYASLRSASLNQALPFGSQSNSGSVPPPPTRASSIPRVAFPPAKSNLPSRLSEGPYSASLVPSASSRWNDSQFSQAQSPVFLNPPQPQQSISDQDPALRHAQDQPQPRSQQPSESQAQILVESNPEASPAQLRNLPDQPADEPMVKSEETDETEVGKEKMNEISQESNGRQEEEEEEVLTPPPRESSFQLPQMPTNDSIASLGQDEASVPVIKSEEERDELDSDSDSDHELA